MMNLEEIDTMLKADEATRFKLSDHGKAKLAENKLAAEKAIMERVYAEVENEEWLAAHVEVIVIEVTEKIEPVIKLINNREYGAYSDGLSGYGKTTKDALVALAKAQLFDKILKSKG
jgi:hypothetical protein